MCMGTPCGGSKASSNHKSGYTPKSRSAGRASSGQLPKGWATGGNSGNNKAYGSPKIRMSFSGRKH